MPVGRLPARERAGLVPALRALLAAAGDLDPTLVPPDATGPLAGLLDTPADPAPLRGAVPRRGGGGAPAPGGGN